MIEEHKYFAKADVYATPEILHDFIQVPEARATIDPASYNFKTVATIERLFDCLPTRDIRILKLVDYVVSESPQWKEMLVRFIALVYVLDIF